MRKCPKCGHNNKADAVYCTHCGYQLRQGHFAIECPNCGKLCPMDAKVCPSCHHRLPQVHRSKIHLQPLRSHFNAKVLKIIASVAIIVFIAFMAYSLNIGSMTRSNSPYTVARLVYFDRDHHRLDSDYYVVKQTISSKPQYRFTMAQVGRNQRGLNRVRKNDVVLWRRQFYRYPHVQLTIGRRITTIKRDGRITERIKYNRRQARDNQVNQGSGSKFPIYKRRQFPVRNSSQRQVRYVKFDAPLASAGD